MVFNDRLIVSFNEDADLDPVSIPFMAKQPLRKGMTNNSCGTTTIDAKTREMLLLAIARSYHWMDQIMSGARASFDAIAEEEQLTERYVRRLMQLAFLSPKIIEAIENGTAPAGLTISQLIQSPLAWTQQEQLVGRP